MTGALLSTLLVGIPGLIAQAVPLPTWDTSSLSPQDLRVHGDGSVTITDCNNYTQQTNGSIVYAAQTFGAAGGVITKIPKSTSDNWMAQTCQQTSVAGTDSAFFLLQEKNGWTYNGRIAAYKNDAVRWSHLYECDGGQDLRPQAMQLGADGNIYAVFYDPSGTCTEYANGKKVLVGINVANGSEIFRQDFVVTETWNEVWLYAQDSRLVVKSAKELLFFDYAGSALTSQTVSAGNLYNDRFQYYVGAGEDSLIYQLKKNNQLSSGPVACPSFKEDATLFLKQGSSSPADIGLDDCEYLYNLLALPNGDIAYVYQSQGTGQYKLKRRTVSGNVVYDFALTDLSGYDVYLDSIDMREDLITADSAGNVYLKRRVKQTPSNPLSDVDIRVDKVNSSGVISEVFSTAELDDPGVSQSRAGMYTQSGGLAGDRLYVPICKNQCSSTSQSFVAVVDETVGFDYPRSKVFAAHPQLNYVALGDSFSSGEGVEPFYEATDISEEDTEDEELQNMCHRSRKAYSELLANTPGSGLKLIESVACSGAEAKHVLTTEQWNEGKQIDALSADTDFVTITIGGNDMGFRSFAEACASVGTGSVDCSGQPYVDAMANIENDVAPNIEDTLDAIDTKLTNADSDAQVLVLGYPQILPETWVSQLSTDCIWLFEDEHYAIRDVIDTLNDTIKDKVEDKGGRFTFVSVNGANSPFNGHGLCQTAHQPYFNGLILGQNKVYSFHPNAYGQEAYKTIVLDHLS